MNKQLRIAINVIILLVVVGFVWYMYNSMKEENAMPETQALEEDDFVSPMELVNTINFDKEITRFDVSGSNIYIASKDVVYVLDTVGTQLSEIKTGEEIRDIYFANNEIYLLFPEKIEVYNTKGQKQREWEACSSNSDYCSFAVTSDFVFVTDAENKNICKYKTDGSFVIFINSPNNFIIPSYTFDIENINDTLYCVNSGRYQIESYTLDGKYITAFGESGTKDGTFVGCCNPVYISSDSKGNLITSEKGIPRISKYALGGAFDSNLLNNRLLGGGHVAYRIKASDNKLYISGNKEIRVYKENNDLL